LVFGFKINFAKTIIIGSQSTSSLSYTGFNSNFKYSSAEFTINYLEIKDTGLIKSFSFYKTGGDSTTSGIDSVSIYLKESDSAIGSFATTSGYLKVFNGIIPNNIAEGWVTTTFSAPFIYSGTKNINVLIVRNNGTKMTTSLPSYSVSYDPQKKYFAAYFNGNVNPWKSFPSKSFQNINGQYRPYLQLEID
jgi:hypothetical protein